jgi:hypothetical protein
MVQDAKPVGLDGTRVCFDDERAVSDAGVMLVATLAQRLGIEELAQDGVRLRRDRPGAANAGRKVMALVYAMVLGADSIDDCDVLRAGRTGRLLGGWIPAPSTLGTFLRAFTFGHVRQLDWLLGRSVERAWQAGAGSGNGRLVVDVDSFVGEVCGRLKRGAAYGYTKLLGYHPILATRADTREVLHIRMRKGSANTQKGMLRFCQELAARVDRAGARGEKLLRVDSGFWNTKVFEYLEKIGWQYSIGVRNIKKIRSTVDAIDETAWQHIDYPAGGEAQIADRLRRPAADRQTHPPHWRPGRAVSRLAALRLDHQPYRRSRRGRGRAPRSRRRRAGHRRPQRPGTRALSLRRLRRQRRVDCSRRARAQPAALDTAARAARDDRSRGPHPAPPTHRSSRPSDAPRPRLDAASPRPLALAAGLHPSVEAHPRASRRRLTAGRAHRQRSDRFRPPRARTPLPANTYHAPNRAPPTHDHPPLPPPSALTHRQTKPRGRPPPISARQPPGSVDPG